MDAVTRLVPVEAWTPFPRPSLSVRSRRAHMPGGHDQKRHGRRGGGLPGGFVFGGDLPGVTGFDRYLRGNATVVVQQSLEIPVEGRDQMLSTVGRLHDLYPNRRVTYVVTEKDSEMMGDDTYAWTVRPPWQQPGSIKTVAINAALFGPEMQKRFTDGVWLTSQWQPVAKMVSPIRYVVAHEFGHVLQPPSVEGRTDAVTRAWQQSGYQSPLVGRRGSMNQAEAFAEAFTEFTLSSGETTDPFVQALAADQGWKF